MSLRIVAHGRTDRGILRSKNEDFLLVDPGHGVFAVADGVGGLPHGQDASREAIASLQRSLQLPTDELGWYNLEQAFVTANTDVLALCDKLQSPLNIGTTMTAIQIKGDAMHFAHIGDSALFRFKDGWCEKITRDHTVAEEHTGGWSPYRAQEMRNVLTRCIGAPGHPEVDTGSTALEAGSWLLLCTDGLFRGVSPDEVREWFTASANPSALCDRLIALVNSRGGPDNSTAIVIRVEAA